MAVGLAARDSQHRVQEQDALPGPGGEVTASGLVAQVRPKLLQDVSQRRWVRGPRAYAERQPHGLSRLVVRILPQDDYAYGVGVGQS